MKNIFCILLMALTLLMGCQSPQVNSSKEKPTRNIAQANQSEDMTNLPAFADVDPDTKSTAMKIAQFQKDLVTNDLKKDAEKTARRDTHSKQHGCIRATFKVNSDLPSEFQTTLFKAGANYKSWIRFANGINGLHHDLTPDARAMSIKLMGVKGEKVLDGLSDEEHYTQDFVMNNYPAFFVDGPADTYEFFNDVHNNKPALFFVSALKPNNKPRQRALFDAINIQSHAEANLLTATYWTGTPFKHGSYIGKYLAKPCEGFVDERVKKLPYAGMSDADKKWIAFLDKIYKKYNPMSGTAPELTDPPALFTAEAPIILGRFQTIEKKLSSGAHDYLKQAMQEYLSSDKGACFDFGIQLYSNDKDTPIESPSITWFPSKTKFVPLAKIEIPKQSDFSEPQNQNFCEDLSFSPWHAAKDHMPVGKLNQMRGLIYRQISIYRHGLNARARGEPLDNFERNLVTPEQADHFYAQ